VAYRVDISPPAARQIRKLRPEVGARLRPHIDALAENPRPDGVKKMKGVDNQYRVRAGDFRIVFSVQDNDQVVLILKVADRKDVYD
jgi:mRNA interferase RelE/StbE